MNEINIVYIDDNLAQGISRALDELVVEINKKLSDDEKITYNEILFSSNLDITQVINNPLIDSNSIIVMDSKLFENSTAKYEYHGEELELILKMRHPFINVIIVSANDDTDKLGILKKYAGYEATYDIQVNYYKELFNSEIKSALKNIRRNLKLRKRLDNVEGDTVFLKLAKKISEELRGIALYKELTDTKIDDLISRIEELKEEIENEK